MMKNVIGPVLLLAALASAQWLETTIPVGDYPSLLCYNSRSNKVYCAYQGDHPVSVIDGATNQVTGEIAVGSEVTGLCYNPASNKLYCSYWNIGAVTVICGDGDTVIDQVPAQVCRGPMCCDSAGNRVYCGGDTGDVTVICGAGDSVLRVVHASGEAASMTYSPDHRKVYAGFDYYPQRDTVFVIGCLTDSIVAAVPVSGLPAWQCYNSVSDCVYCPDGWDTLLTVIDCATNKAERIGIRHGVGPMSCVPAENKVFGLGSLGVIVLDATSHQIIDTVYTSDWYVGILFDPLSNRVFCSSQDSNRVAVLDGATNHLLKTMAVGDWPLAMCFNPVQNRVYVANGMSASVTVIRDSMPVATHESPWPQASNHKLQATVMHSLPVGATAFDAMGRRVRDPKPGVYFVRDEGRGAGDAGRTRKVILQK